MEFEPYEREARLEIERWQRGDNSWLRQMLNVAMSPVDWVSERFVAPQVLDQADELVTRFFSTLNDVSKWTVSHEAIQREARARGLQVERIEDLRGESLETLDPIARSLFTQSAVAAAIQGGGAGLGGIALIAADIPVLFTINLRLIQQVAAAYGFNLQGPDYEPLVLSVFNVAASGSPYARHQALREVSVAAAAFAHDGAYRGHVSGTWKAQNRHVAREIAKNVLGRKLAQVVPIAGAAVGAGVNYWFTTSTAEAAYMVFRALHVECRERAA